MKKMIWVFLLMFALSSPWASFAFAAEEPLGQEAKKFIGLACGLAIAIAALGGGLGQGIAISKGLEGVVVKRVDSLYEAGGRNFNWVKLKRHSSGELSDTIDCVVLGYIFGKI